MWILSKDKQCIVNADTIDSFYTVQTGVRARFARANKDLTIGEYDSKQYATQALCMIHKSLSLRADVFKMPDDETARADFVATHAETKDRSANGKKTVRRGGS